MAEDDGSGTRRRGASASRSSAPRPSRLPAPELGPLRPPRAGRQDGEHRGLLQRHRPRPEVGSPQGAQGPKSGVAKAWRPKQREFNKFVQAVGRATAASTRTRTTAGSKLPGVHLVAVERAQPGAAGCARSGWTARRSSPQLYRKLCVLRAPRAHLDGHGNDYDPRRRDRADRRRAAGPRIGDAPEDVPQRDVLLPRTDRTRVLGLRKYGPIIARRVRPPPVHQEEQRPTSPNADPNALTLANINDLGSCSTRLRRPDTSAPTMPLISSEFGYETNPPDPYPGPRCSEQANSTASSATC